MNSILQDSVRKMSNIQKKIQNAVTKLIKKGTILKQCQVQAEQRHLEWVEKTGLWKVTVDHGKPHWDVAVFYIAFHSRASIHKVLFCFLPVPRGKEKTRMPHLRVRSPFCCQSLKQVRSYSCAGHFHNLHYDSKEHFMWSTTPCVPV